MMKTYSPFFETLYDQEGPVGHLGRGTHYSVLRSVTWFDERGNRICPAKAHDFAVIWDEDHDVRIVETMEDVYQRGLFYAVDFIGERKGHLSVIVSAGFDAFVTGADFDTYADSLSKLAEGRASDSWNADVVPSSCIGCIINDEAAKVSVFLQSIRGMWSLGHKPFAERAVAAE